MKRLMMMLTVIPYNPKVEPKILKILDNIINLRTKKLLQNLVINLLLIYFNVILVPHPFRAYRFHPISPC